MNPAAVLSTLVKVQGLSTATGQLAAYDKQSAKAATGAGKLTAAAEAQGAAAKTSSKHVGSATKAIGGMIGAFAGYSVVNSAVKTTEDFTKQTLALSKNFGLSMRAASEWGAVMRARGVESKQLQMGFKTLSTQVKSASDGSAKAADTFKVLGISQGDLAKHGNDLNWILGSVSDGLAKLPPGTNKAAVMSKLFGRTWQGIAPVIRDGSKSMNDQLAVADKYGATLSGSTKATEAMVAKQREMDIASLGLKLTLGQVLMPVLTFLATSILNIVSAFRNAPPTVKIVALAVLGLSAAFAALNLVMNMNPYVRIASLLALLAVAFITAYKHSAKFREIVAGIGAFFQQVGAAISSFVNSLGIDWSKIPAMALAAFNAIRGAIQPTITWLTTAWGNLTNWLVTAWRNASNYLGPTIQNLAIIFSKVFGMIKTVVSPFVGFISGVMTMIAVPLKTLAGVVGIVFVGAWRTAFNLIKIALGGFAKIVSGAMDVIRGIIKVFAGLLTLDFGKMWDGIKQIFSGVWRVLNGIISAGMKGAIAIVTGSFNAFWNAGKFIIGAIGDGIKGAWSGVIKIVQGFLQALVTPINLVLGALGVKQITFHFAEGGVYGGGGKAFMRGVGGGHPAGYATGGMVKSPGYFAGEEAPRHPEVILATNPAYRQRNLGLWAKAGSMLGVPGFVQGGVPTGGGPTLSQSQLEALWRAANPGLGDPRLMGAIAMAESHGEDVMNSIGATGYWQIHPGGPQYFDPMTNARAAGDKLRTQGLRAWEAYTNGAYKKFLGGGGVFSTIGAVLGDIVDAGKSVLGDVMGLLPSLPSAPHLPKPFTEIPGALLGMVKKWISSKIGSLFGGGGGASASHLGTMMPNWMGIDALAKQYGLAMTSGYRPGDTGSYHASGRARDYSNGTSTPQELAFARGVASAYGANMAELIHTPLGWGIKNGQRVDQNAVYGAVLAAHYNHVHTAFRKGGMYAGAFANGGVVTANRPTLAMFGENGPETAMFIPHFQGGGISGAGSALLGAGSLVAPTLMGKTIGQWWNTGGAGAGGGGGGGAAGPTDWRGALGIPALPTVSGSVGRTPGDSSRIAGRISNLKSNMESVQHQLSITDSAFNFSNVDLLDPTTGLRNEPAIASRVAQLQQLAELAHTIFTLYGQVIVLIQRLAATYQNVISDLVRKKANTDSMVKQLQGALSTISLKGLKGAALTRAKNHRADISKTIQRYQKMSSLAGTDITKFQGKRTDVLGQVTSLMDERDSSWIEWQQKIREWQAVANTVAQPVGALGLGTGSDTLGSTAGAAPSTIGADNALVTAQQMLNIAQSQSDIFKNIPYLGGAASGGMVTVGERGPELVDLPAGSRIFSHRDSTSMSSPTIVIQVMDGAVNGDYIRVLAGDEAEKAINNTASDLVNRTIGNRIGVSKQTPSAPRRLASY